MLCSFNAPLIHHHQPTVGQRSCHGMPRRTTWTLLHPPTSWDLCIMSLVYRDEPAFNDSSGFTVDKSNSNGSFDVV